VICNAETLNNIRNSVVNHSLCISLFASDLQTESELIYYSSLLGTNDRRLSLTCSTASKVGASIQHS
jgi:hypothetical protein